MLAGQPSRTALGAAAHRAAHQTIDQRRIFADPLAVRILGADAEALIAEATSEPSRHLLRLFIALRTRLAEDAFEAAFAAGTRQLVVLGAGLDTYAYRSTLEDGLRIFEVDHPATQAWKHQLLKDAAITIPGKLTFAPVDFESGKTLGAGLSEAGFDPARETFFTWLGVVPYLTDEAFAATLGFIASGTGGAHVVFDYANPPASISEDEGRAAHEELAARVASVGEAFRSYFETDQLSARLVDLGFAEVDDLDPARLASRFSRVAAGHLAEAALTSCTRRRRADSLRRS